MVGKRRFGLTGCMVAATVFLAAGDALANDKAAACVAELQKEYGGTAAIRSECNSKSDCTFQAPAGNASARALIQTIAERAEACFKSAGLSQTKEEKQDVGVTRSFNGEGEGQCAVLISAPSGMPPEGVRAICRPE